MKLSEITEALVALIPAMNAHIEKVQASGNVKDMLVLYYNLKAQYDALDDARKMVYEIKDRMDKFLIPEAIDSTGFDKVQVPDVAKSFYTNTKYSASILDKVRGYEWLRANGAESLITETVNASTLANYAKDYILEKGKDLPEDIFKVSTYRTTGMSNYTPKNK